jgi:hypothetical protein
MTNQLYQYQLDPLDQVPFDDAEKEDYLKKKKINLI